MINVIIPAAGVGSRFKNYHTLPKPLIPVNGEPMLTLAVRTLGFDAKYYALLRDDVYLEQATQAFKSAAPDATIITITETTQGPAASGLLFEQYIDPDDELIIANCDQVTDWNSNLVIESFRQYDAAVVTYNSVDPKNSFAKLETDRVIEIKEKSVISNCALVGIHYWKKAKYFFDSAKRMIAENNKTNGEFYVGPTYNYLIADGLHVGIYNADNSVHLIGTPQDLKEYLDEGKQSIIVS